MKAYSSKYRMIGQAGTYECMAYSYADCWMQYKAQVTSHTFIDAFTADFTCLMDFYEYDEAMVMKARGG